eukprot:UN07679
MWHGTMYKMGYHRINPNSYVDIAKYHFSIKVSVLL